MELKCLGVVYTIQNCAFYIIGAPKPFTVVTDHKPLLGVFYKPLSETPNPRLQRLRLKVVGANVRLTWEGGKHNLIADALSRAPVSAAAPLDAGEQQEEAVFVRALSEGDVEAASWLYLNAQEDDDYQKLLGAHLGGCRCETFRRITKLIASMGSGTSSARGRAPTGASSSSWMGPASSFPAGLANGSWSFSTGPMPASSRHSRRPASSTTGPACPRQYLMRWKNVSSVQRPCPASRWRPCWPPLRPLGPMQAVGLDPFHAGGRDYLIIVDRYSGYLFEQCLASTMAAAVTRALAGWWELFSFPSVVRADRGPQFCCQEFLAFCSERDINPRSNGLAEAAVKNCKRLLQSYSSAFFLGGEITPTSCLNSAIALGRTGSRRRSSCSAGTFGRHSRRLQGRLSRFPWRRRRRQGRKRMRQP